MKPVFTLFILVCLLSASAQQQLVLRGRVMVQGQPIVKATVGIQGTGLGSVTDSTGYFNLVLPEKETYMVKVSAVGFTPYKKLVNRPFADSSILSIELQPAVGDMSEIVVTGTLKAVS
ncbi:MAG TPA: carboxypeptidase-like regulatory domain-containing protein, partial [Agriterribacter sp.]|nr:carboxypeptidase-like regulatory domain-containing protein [Agriterribacter sp.]